MIQTGKVWVAAVAIALATVVAPATSKAQAPQGTGFYIRADIGLASWGQAATALIASVHAAASAGGTNHTFSPCRNSGVG